jgi:hypothetical protein
MERNAGDSVRDPGGWASRFATKLKLLTRTSKRPA